MHRVLDLYSEVTPGETYYLSAECYPSWSPSHGAGSSNYGLGTIWYYVSKAVDSSSTSYSKAVCFNSSNWVKEGLWSYTVPADHHMIKIRVNTYANGTDSVTAKFWNIRVVPASACADERIAAMKVTEDRLYINEIVEM